jgi:hypothetical protein
MSAKKRKIEAKLFPFAARQPLWDMAKKHGKMKYSIVAIWDYMWWRSGKGGLFELAEDIVCWDLGCDATTLRSVRKILIAEGWLRKETLRDKGGKWMTRGFTVIPKGVTEPKSTGGEDQPPSREPALEQSTVDTTSDGKSPHTVEVHVLDAFANTSRCEPSAHTSAGLDLLTDGQTRDSLRSSCSSTPLQNQELNQTAVLGQEQEQPQKQDQDDDPLMDDYQIFRQPRTVEEWASMPYLTVEMQVHQMLYPNATDKLIAEGMPVIAAVCSFPDYVDEPTAVLAMIKWNHLHENGKFRIRTAKQLFNALTAKSMAFINNYDTHPFDECPKCKRANLKPWRVEAEIKAMRELNEQDAQRMRELMQGKPNPWKAAGV